MPANVEDVSLIAESERSPGEGSDNPFQYSCWNDPMDIPWRNGMGYRGAWWATVNGVANVQNDLVSRQQQRQQSVVILQAFFKPLLIPPCTPSQKINS